MYSNETKSVALLFPISIVIMQFKDMCANMTMFIFRDKEYLTQFTRVLYYTNYTIYLKERKKERKKWLSQTFEYPIKGKSKQNK